MNIINKKIHTIHITKRGKMRVERYIHPHYVIAFLVFIIVISPLLITHFYILYLQIGIRQFISGFIIVISLTTLFYFSHLLWYQKYRRNKNEHKKIL